MVRVATLKKKTMYYFVDPVQGMQRAALPVLPTVETRELLCYQIASHS